MDVRDSRFARDEDDVIRGVPDMSVRWRERVGCCDGRLAMSTSELMNSRLVLCLDRIRSIVTGNIAVVCEKQWSLMKDNGSSINHVVVGSIVDGVDEADRGLRS